MIKCFNILFAFSIHFRASILKSTARFTPLHEHQCCQCQRVYIKGRMANILCVVNDISRKLKKFLRKAVFQISSPCY